jgi:hypothetical protein
MHRLGSSHYKEARGWLLLGMAIARWMKIGRDNAHGEMILGKIYIEQEQPEKAFRLLKRAERIAERREPSESWRYKNGVRFLA